MLKFYTTISKEIIWFLLCIPESFNTNDLHQLFYYFNKSGSKYIWTKRYIKCVVEIKLLKIIYLLENFYLRRSASVDRFQINVGPQLWSPASSNPIWQPQTNQTSTTTTTQTSSSKQQRRDLTTTASRSRASIFHSRGAHRGRSASAIIPDCSSRTRKSKTASTEDPTFWRPQNSSSRYLYVAVGLCE